MLSSSSLQKVVYLPRALTKGASDWEGAGDGDTRLGVNDLPSAWHNGMASEYSDGAALILMSL